MTEKNKTEEQETKDKETKDKETNKGKDQQDQKDQKDQKENNTKSVNISTIIIVLLLAVIAAMLINNSGFFDEYSKSETKTTVTLVSHKQSKQSKNDSEVLNFVTPHISEQVKIHILYGDETGGAHYYTVKTPCKSIFPKSWNPDKIIAVTEKIAANDNLEWKKRKNGNMYAQSMEDGILVRVIMDANRQFVKTSYPLNAGRTFCPKDNEKTQSKIVKETKYFKVLDSSDVKTKSQKNYNQ